MKMVFFQKSLFDTDEDNSKKSQEIKANLSDIMISRFQKYTLTDYIADIEQNGLSQTWAWICQYVLVHGENTDFLHVKNFGEMYEIGLAVQDKIQKKNNGQYYTPEDVALVMSEWLDSLDGENICDVACGTGKLILTYLDFIGEEKAKNLISAGRLFLYDVDSVALNICVTSILLKYGRELKEKIHIIDGDFLSAKNNLPENCKVISNPPYAAIQQVGFDWKETQVLNDSRELYSYFMEKNIKNCNSVRAAITVVRKDNCDGFRLTPLIRFKSTERKELLQCKMLESFLSPKQQKISQTSPAYFDDRYFLNKRSA